MAFPTTKTIITSMPGSSTLAAAGHSTRHNNEIKPAIEALEDKVGLDGSAVTTSHDYKLSGVTGTDKSVSKAGTETLTNKTLTSPTITNKTSTGTDNGTETLVNKTLTSPIINGNPAGTFGNWTTWTPILTVSGGTAPTYTGNFVSRYCQVGKIVFCEIVWTNDSSGTASSGTSPIIATLPVTAANVTGDPTGGGGFFYNSTTIASVSIAIVSTGSFTVVRTDTVTTLTGDLQNNAIRYIKATWFYEAA
jgi:hypothetical protein